MRCVRLLLLLALVACAPGEQAGAPPEQATTAAPTPTPAPTTTAPTTTAPTTTAPSPPAPVPCPDSDAVLSATWTVAEGGRSLAVVPSEELRACAGPLVRWDGIPPGWADVTRLAGEEADSPALRQQYVCHLRFARAKETWNLEPWRPEVDEQTLLQQLCNP